MKNIGLLLCCFPAAFSVWLFSGCSSSHLGSSNEGRLNIETVLTNANKISLKDQSGAERIFTNAHVVMWVPSRAVHVWDGHTTSVVDIDETTPPGAFVKDYKITVEIQIVDTPQRLKQMERWAASDWYFQEHPELSITEAQYGKQMRKDIWNRGKSRRLLINARVKRSDTFAQDVETAKKMIESIKLIPK